MSAFGGKANITRTASMSAFDPKRTSGASAFDPKRTFRSGPSCAKSLFRDQMPIAGRRISARSSVMEHIVIVI